jgi:hypothetical protein
MLVGGLALFTAGIAICVWRAFRAVAFDRLVAAGVIALVGLLRGNVSGVVVLAVMVAVVLATLVVENHRIEQVGIVEAPELQR